MLIWLVAILALAGCDFRPMEERSNTHYVRIYLNEDIMNITSGFYNPNFYHPPYVRPDIIRVGLFDQETGALVAERYLRNQGDDELGHYYDGYIIAEPGNYNLIAYNFGTESTVIGDEYNCYDMTAYTNEIASNLKSKLKGKGNTDEIPENLRYDADHLFVARCSGVRVPNTQIIDTLSTPDGDKFFKGESIVKSYYLQIGIKGAQYISSTVSLLSGMASSANMMENETQDASEATLYFDMRTGDYPSDPDMAVVYTTFGTFGKLEDQENHLSISFQFLTTYGALFDVTLDITELFENSNAKDHQWIIIDKVVTIPDPPDPPNDDNSGLAPTVTDWNDVFSDLHI